LEKPYTVHYTVSGWAGNVPRTNLTDPKAEVVRIEDIRGQEAHFSFQENGFAVLEMDSTLPYEEFENRAKVEKVYCQELASILLRYFDAQAVQFSDIEVSCHSHNYLRPALADSRQIRRRHPDFPNVAMTKEVAEQPASIVHLGKQLQFNEPMSLDEATRD